MIYQLFFNSIVSGLLLALVAVGFNLIYSTTKVFHLAHGAIYISGAYCFFWLTGLGLPLWLCVTVTALFTAVLAILHEWLVYLPLYNKKSGEAITLISSMGLYLFIVNTVALLFSNESKILHHNLGDSIIIQSLIIAPIQAVQLVVSTLVIGLFLWHARSKKFLQVKAVISESVVASVMGVNIFSVRLYALVVGSLLAVTAAVLLLYDTGINPQSGMNITLTAVVAVVVGGTGTFKGTVAASFLIAFMQTGTEWFLSAQWKEAITFILLTVILLWRTEGIVSANMRVEEL